MVIRKNTLPDDPEALKKIILQLQNKVNFLEEQFLLARSKQFSASTEASSGQGELFNEPESEMDAVQAPEAAPETEEIHYSRQKPKRKPLPKDLPREEIIHDLQEEEKICGCCDGPLHKMGEERSEQLEYIPAQLKVLEHVRPKYSCRDCEKNGTQTRIVIAPVPASPIPKSIATPSLLSQIITHKYQFALPLYRQEVLFKQYGIDLSRKTMSSWMLRCAELLNPIVERLKQHLKEQPVIHADETTLKVIKDEKTKSYMWLYCTGTDSPESQSDIKNIVLYDYQPSRSSLCVVNYLDGYEGYLQADGYAAYEKTNTTLVGCMAHARRKFIEAEKGQKVKKAGKAQWAINHIKKIYRVESQIAGKSAEERFRVRLEKSKPLMDEFKEWLNKSVTQVAPKTLIGQAVQYSLNQWEKLYTYLYNGQLSIDNNRAERAIKPFVIGRKNWMFSNTANGANASATLYSLIETAKANALDPNEYLKILLSELPRRNAADEIDDLMPWEIKL